MAYKTEDRLSHYLSLYREVHAKVGDDQIAIALVHELAKDARMAQIQAERRNASFESDARREARMQEPATTRQLALLRALNVTVERNLTKLEASKLIDEAKLNAFAG